MRTGNVVIRLVVLLALCAAGEWSGVQADPPDGWCATNSPYGNASTGDVLEIPSVEHPSPYLMSGDEDWHTVIVHEGATLDTGGHRLRVCETLTNDGTITDSQSGGAGGAAGLGGVGEDHWGAGNPAGPGACGGGGINREGKGGGGGGGGGGAWIESGAHLDADGGDGGNGGQGGQGGGTVRVYAYRLVNNGLIHADGGDGGPGMLGEDGEYTRDPPRSCKDIAGGGGGGGGGGDGGDGGILEIRYADPTSTLGTYHADGGSGGVGAAGGLGQCLVCGDYPLGYEFRGLGAAGCDVPPEGGDGGDGAYEEDTCSESGSAGADGAGGEPGTVTVVGPWQACCLPDHSCVTVDMQSCTELGGTPQGDGTECGEVAACVFSDHTCEDIDPGCCASFGGTPYPGELCGLQACCFDGTSTCEDLSAENCLQQGGQPAGPGTECTGSRACYFEEGSCRDLDPECCVLIGGTPGGPYCDEQACCFEDSSCLMLEPPACTSAGGLPMGSGAVCDGMECPQACWFSDDHCENLPPSECPGVFVPGWCKGVEACCVPDEPCRMIDAVFCPLLDGTPVPGSDCTEPQACCLPDSPCQMIDPVCCELLGGTPQYGLACAQPQACCMSDGTCQMDDPVCCELKGGAPQYGLVCAGVPQACCLEDGTCRMLDPLCCEVLDGAPQPPGSVCTELRACCLPDGTCQMVDPVCCGMLEGTPQPPGSVCTELRACCLPDGTCQMVDPVCCGMLEGTPQPPGSVCTELRACCLSDGTCQMVDPLCCDEVGGTVSVYSQQCLGDHDGNGVDDGCQLEGMADCTGLSDYQQPFDTWDFGEARFSDEQTELAVAEDLVNASGEVMPMLTAPVAQIRWWGISLEYAPGIGPVAPCNADDAARTPYVFKFYAGDASGPGMLLATRQAAPATMTDTGVRFTRGAHIKEYTADFDPPVCHENVTWISIQRKTGAHAANGNPCYFLWVDEDFTGTYNDQAYQDELVETDQTICVGVFAGSTVGACCNESGAPFQTPQGEIPNFGCLEGVDLCDCAEPGLRFSLGDCETGFTPGCGYGACCYLDGEVRTCVEVTQDECTTLGGYRFRIGEECPEDISIFCYPPPANDTCATAIDYTACPMTFDSTGAETDVLVDDPPVDLGFQPQNDVYFKYQIPASGAYSPAYTDGLIVITTYGSNFDTCVVCYRDTMGNNCPNFDCEDLQILDSSSGQPQGVNNDMAPGERYTSIARVEVSAGGGSVDPGDCILIRVAGLSASQSTTPPGGQGVLRVDFLPFLGGQYASDVGVCCLPAGCQIQRSVNAAADCRAAGGWFRPYTDFLEGAAAPGYDNTAAGGAVPQLAGCCATYPCEEGDFAGNPYVLGPLTVKDTPVTLTVNRHNVTYFKFQTPLVLGETNALSIDTCGTPFDTILSIYRYNQPSDLDDAGDVHGDAEVGDEYTETPLFRIDNCYGVDPQATCFADPDSLDSCMCLTVGQIDDDLATTTWYIVKVGMKDERGGGCVRADGIDPVPNWPYDEEVPVTITLTWHDECIICLTDCCKGDMDNSEMADMADVPVFVDAVLGRGAFAGGLACDQWEFCTADMNNDYKVDGRDIQDFLYAVIYGWDCTPDPINCMDEDPDYCQIRNGGTFTPSDLKTGGEDHYTIVDNFSSLSGGYINQICWWGVFMTFDGGWTGDCGPGSGTFRITYINDAGGIPGTVKAGPFTVTPTITQLDPLNFGTFTAYEYLMDATHPLIGIGRDECIWVEIAADNGAGTCCFLWESAGPGDLIRFQDEDSDGYQRSDRQVGDLAFCVNVVLNPYGCLLDTTCSPVCPGGDAIIEGETGVLDPCSNEDHVDTVNGGCDSDPYNPPLLDIPCNSIVCGTAGWWTQMGEAECDHDHDCPEGQVCSGHICTGGPYEMLYRDTDWYKLHVIEEQEVTLTVNAGDVEFPYMIGFMTGTDCSDSNLGIDPRATGLPCQSATVRACLPAGEHWILFAPWACWLAAEPPSEGPDHVPPPPPPPPPPIPPWEWLSDRGAPPGLIGCDLEYVFSVSCSDCPYCQEPNGESAVLSDDSTNGGRNWVADNFRPSEPGGVTRAHWYGVNEGFGLDERTECDFSDERYTIRYYLDDGSGSQGYAGFPGALLAEVAIGSNFSKTDTGAVLGDSRVWEYTATHPMVPVNAGQCYWVSVVQDAAHQNCVFRWHSNWPGSDGQGDGVSATSGDSGDSWEPQDADVGEFAWCVNAAAEPEGCGVDVAACCVEGDCIGDLSEYYCTMSLGAWHEGESCDTFTCPQPVTCCTNSLTQLNNPNLLEDFPYSCRLESGHHNLDNFFARSYTHSSRYVNCVHFGVRSTEGTPIVMRTRIYKDANGGLPDNSMTLVATSLTPIPPYTSNAFFTAYFSPSAYVTSGGKVVYEHYYPESFADLYIGANTAGATNSTYHTYWKSACHGNNEWIDMQNYASDPDMADWQLVQRVRWSTGP